MKAVRVRWWLDDVRGYAHARPWQRRGNGQGVALCGARLSLTACLNLGIRPLCPRCVAVIVEEAQGT